MMGGGQGYCRFLPGPAKLAQLLHLLTTAWNLPPARVEHPTLSSPNLASRLDSYFRVFPQPSYLGLKTR